MAFFTIDSVEFDVISQGASRGYETFGSIVRAFDGSLRSTERGEKRNWKLVVGPFTRTEYDTFYNYARGASNYGNVYISGDLVNNESILSKITIENAPISKGNVKVGQTDDFYYTVSIKIDEV